MIEKDNNTLKAYTGPLSRTLREEYTIGEEYYRGDVKRGLRNSDGTGVLVGVSKVGSVQGYLIQDGQRIPAPGRLYYRGIGSPRRSSSRSCSRASSSSPSAPSRCPAQQPA